MVLAAYHPRNNEGHIYLYGEVHAEPKVIEKELELWRDYYHEKGMRHLFIEYAYYHAEFLNLWMRSDSDEILDEMWEEFEGTAGAAASVKEFYKKVKEECPETIFHGTDVGHQYKTTGERYLKYLRENGQENTPEYRRTLDVIKQGKKFYEGTDEDSFAYRECMMVKNFMWEFDKLKGEDIMGIYGNAHVGIGDMYQSADNISSMAAQLARQYKGKIFSEDLTAYSDSSVSPGA